MILSCQDIWVGGSIEFVLAFTFFFNRFCRMWLGINIACRLRLSIIEFQQQISTRKALTHREETRNGKLWTGM